ncbi:2-oxoadipate dehydrogenase complex component E1-like [Saccostrea echinata]|uniref:2-oxoadipate dehydrogenase complex component E1-like n=1 Tax=Saccostrea echinata TaxID=191078 RepID=UPI002A7F35FF|nr:2-oxoadipate dehydrogenase complex component E1-like [Saccostrea echinata]
MLSRLKLLHSRHLQLFVDSVTPLNAYHTKCGVYGHHPRTKTESKIDTAAIQNRIQQSNVYRLVEAYRTFGHRKASLDPLQLAETENVQELDARLYGISADSNQIIQTEGIFNGPNMTIEELVKNLESVYCGPAAIEFQHLEDVEEREWLAQAFETRGEIELTTQTKKELADLMLRCQAFDHFLASKFVNVKRYGGEGGESMMAIFEEIFNKCSQNSITDVVICMPHRGRLNFLTCMLKFPPVIMFRKMKGLPEFPPNVSGSGDVLSHLYTSINLNYGDKDVHVSLIPNPSHLEANNPVAVGKARAKQQNLQCGEYIPDPADEKVLCVQVHGDASFSAQGIVAETFSIAECPHFNVGGSIHLIVNNQVGFTTEASRGRSSRYSSCLAKINAYPVLHVNADFPEEVLRVTSIAMDYRKKFNKDVVIDFICFRKHGHNELDDPSFTQPAMYKAVRGRDSIPNQYASLLVSQGLCEQETLNESVKAWNATLSEHMSQVESYTPQRFDLQKQWSEMVQPGDIITHWDTGVSIDLLKFIGQKSVTCSDLKVHPNVQKAHVDRRLERMKEGRGLDWATAEALAFGSLLYQGYNVRVSGQDVGRGTFSHRHGMLVDQETDEMHIPLNHIKEDQTGFLELANSALSEEAVLGFEYGMSIDNPNNLIIWEAQFGDFFNGAQIIIDTYIASGELKWLLQTGLVMLLPHGMDGAGPEHSSCRIERFLQMCDSSEVKVDGDNINMQVVNPTTPAQYFHLLRRQMVRNFRKPLVVVAPKILLRLPEASSTLDEMAPGTTFLPVFGDPDVSAKKVTKVIFCSGKHYYTLVKERENLKLQNVALIRLESLCPFPAAEIQVELNKFSNATDFVWSQEEHRNMGAWSFMSPRFENVLGKKLRYAGRDHLGTPATGIGQIHQAEAKSILQQTFS